MRRVIRLAGPLALYVALGVWLLRPLSYRPADSVADTRGQLGGTQLYADMLLVTSIMAWDCHALAHHPLGLFSANWFHPHPRALALSEHLLGNLPVYGPVYAVSGNPILASNAMMIVSYVLASLAMYWLVRAWTGSAAAALFAGCLFGFAPWRLGEGVTRYQWINFPYLPLILLAFDRLALEPRRAMAALAAGILVLQTLCGYYLGYVAFFAAVVFVAVQQTLAPRGQRHPLAMLAVLVAAAVVLLPLTLPYLGILDVETDPLHWGRAVRRFFWQAGQPAVITRSFVSRTTVVFALAGLGTLVFRPAREARARGVALVGIAAMGYALCLGPGPAWIPIPLPFTIAGRVVPGLAHIRAPMIFGLLVLLGLSGLAGLGAAALLRVAGRWRNAAAFGLVLLGIAAAWKASIAPVPVRSVRTGADVPPVYRWLAAHGEGGPLLELLAFGEEGLGFQRMESGAEAMYFSTFHWLPLLNGYARYDPPDHVRLMEVARRLPDPEALAVLVRETGLRWVLLHDRTKNRALADGLARLAAMRLVDHFGDDVLYEVNPRPSDARLPDERSSSGARAWLRLALRPGSCSRAGSRA